MLQPKDVEHLAAIAYIEISGEEAPLIADHLNIVLQAIKLLKTLPPPPDFEVEKKAIDPFFESNQPLSSFDKGQLILNIHPKI